MEPTSTVTDGAIDVVALYREHRLPLTRLAYLLLGDLADAEDAVHDAFLGVPAGAERLDLDGVELAHLRVAVLDASRSRRRRTSRRHVPPAPGTPGADEPLLLAEEHRAVLAALDGLPARQREVIVLRSWSQLSEAGIAAAMGVSCATVRSAAGRALARLAAAGGAAGDATELGDDVVRAALSVGAEQVSQERLRADGEARLRKALDAEVAAAAVATRRRRWGARAVAAAVIALAVGAATLGVLRHVRGDGTAPDPAAYRPLPADLTAARLLAAHGMRQCPEIPSTSAVPDRAHLRAAHRCTWAPEPEAVPGEGTFAMAVALEVTSGLDDVLDLAEHAASQPPRHPNNNEACALIGYVAEELWVTMDDGRVVRWQVPWAPKPCGGPSEAEKRAWRGLQTKVVAKVRGEQVGSALALATGCTDGLANRLTETSSTAGTDSEPLATPTVAGDAMVCFYRRGADGQDALQAGARLEQLQAHTLASLVGRSVRDETCPAGGRGVVALIEGFTVPGHVTGVLVDLDGCSVAAGYDGGWWRAPQALRDALVQVQASAVRAQAPGKG